MILGFTPDGTSLERLDALTLSGGLQSLKGTEDHEENLCDHRCEKEQKHRKFDQGAYS